MYYYTWFKNFFKKNKSKDIAKKRLQFAIIYDKLDVSEDVLVSLQKDIISVISKYFFINKELLKLNIRHEQNISALIVNIPILKALKRTNIKN